MSVISFFSILWFISGLIAVLTMFRILGGKTGTSSRNGLKWAHRIFGAVFSIGYLVFALFMIPKYQGDAPFISSVLSAHAYLGAALFPLLLIKHLIVRAAKHYYPSLPYIGITILTIAFLVVSFTGINHIILRARGPGVTIQSSEGPRVVSASIGRNLLEIKCARCHGLVALYKGKKDENLWRITIKRMKDYDKALFITDDQVDHLVGYLLFSP